MAKLAVGLLLLCTCAVALVLVIFLRASPPHAGRFAEAPVLWSLSGGGFRAMTVGMSFARVFHRAGFLDEISAVSSNSGGSWFTLQMAFDDLFYASVVSDTVPMSELVSAWLRTRAPLLRVPSAQEVRAAFPDPAEAAAVEATLLVLRAVYVPSGPLVETSVLFTALCATLSAQFRWTSFVTQMLDAGGASASALPFTSGSRTPFVKHAPIFVQLSNVTRQLVAKDTDTDQAVESEVLNAWHRPITGQTQPLLASVAPVGDREAWAPWRRAPTGPLGVLSRAETSVWAPGRTLPLPQVQGGSAPAVGTAASFSSAAACFMGWSKLTQDLGVAGVEAASVVLDGKAHSLPPLPGGTNNSLEAADLVDGCAALFADDGGRVADVIDCTASDSDALRLAFANLSPCADELAAVEAPVCAFPAQRICDGAFADNTATAQALGELQRAHPGRPLRVVIQANHACYWNGPSEACTRDDVAHLFGPGFLRRGSRSRVFARRWSQVDKALDRGYVSRYVRWAVVDTKTTHNKVFGVKGGTPVSVLIFSSDAPVSGFQIYSDAFERNMSALAADVEGAADAIADVLDQWLHR